MIKVKQTLIGVFERNMALEMSNQYHPRGRAHLLCHISLAYTIWLVLLYSCLLELKPKHFGVKFLPGPRLGYDAIPYALTTASPTFEMLPPFL